MIVSEKVRLRPAVDADRDAVANLMHFERYVHRHLGWCSPLELLGKQPYLLLEQERGPIAVLACPEDPPGVAWIHLFAARDGENITRWWDALWESAHETLHFQTLLHAAALPLQPWFKNLLEHSGFEQVDTVVVLARDAISAPKPRLNADVCMRSMTVDDLPDVVHVDETAFPLLWRNSREMLQSAYRQAAVATVAEKDGRIVGYQISTAVGHWAGHLARLAVLPEYQRQGIGDALVRDALHYFSHRGIERVTVNTQEGNKASLYLYRKLGFSLTGESIPMYGMVVS